jgi:hypothetical protein
MVRSILTHGGKRGGPNSSWQRHNDSGGPSSDTTMLDMSGSNVTSTTSLMRLI